MQKTAYRKPATRKAKTPYEQLLAAIARVEQGRKEGKEYRIAGEGTRTDNGQHFYCVPSDSEKLRGLWHVVSVTKTGLDCDCYFSRERHQICTHRATVYLHLKAHPVAPAKLTPPAPRPAAPATNVAQQATTARTDEEQWDRYQMARMAGEL